MGMGSAAAKKTLTSLFVLLLAVSLIVPTGVLAEVSTQPLPNSEPTQTPTPTPPTQEPTPTPEPTTQPTPAPTQPPSPIQPDLATECAKAGGTWDGSTCKFPTQQPSPQQCSPDSHFEDGKGCIPNQQLKQQQGPVCGNGICEVTDSVKEYDTCSQDCPKRPQPISVACPAIPKDAVDKCKTDGGRPIIFVNPQSNCEEFDGCDTGGQNQINQCPTIQDNAKQMCEGRGGNFVLRKDGRGCDFPDCERKQGGNNNGPPPGCREEKDPESGFVRVVCETRKYCPSQQDMDLSKSKCESSKGKFFTEGDSNCRFPRCDFGGGGEQQGGFNFGQRQSVQFCPLPEQLEQEITKCKNFGQDGIIVSNGDCKFAKCVPKENNCPRIPFDEIENKCGGPGMAVKNFDSNGCVFLTCSSEANPSNGASLSEPPAEAYDRCATEYDGKGELVTKKDSQGNIIDVRCIGPGKSSKVGAKLPSKIPSKTELLKIALNLEQLKIQLDQLGQETDGIADYWKGQGSKEEDKFRRVADMFKSANKKIDNIKTEIKNHLNDLTVDDLIGIQEDVKKVSDVILNDILYIMLSSSDDVSADKFAEKFDDTKAKEFRDQRKQEFSGDQLQSQDNIDFNKYFSRCEPFSFEPDGNNGPIVTIIGLEGDACNVKATLPTERGPPAGIVPGINPPYEMNCKFTDYASGFEGSPSPELLKKSCQGNLLKLMEMFGQGSQGQTENGMPQEQPGQATTQQRFSAPKVVLEDGTLVCEEPKLSCRDACGKTAENAQACLDKLGPMLPDFAKEGLQKIASGEFKMGKEGKSTFTGPGGCTTPNECRNYCFKNPQDCEQFGGEGQQGANSGFNTENHICVSPVPELKDDLQGCIEYCNAHPDECAKARAQQGNQNGGPQRRQFNQNGDFGRPQDGQQGNFNNEQNFNSGQQNFNQPPGNFRGQGQQNFGGQPNQGGFNGPQVGPGFVRPGDDFNGQQGQNNFNNQPSGGFQQGGDFNGQPNGGFQGGGDFNNQPNQGFNQPSSGGSGSGSSGPQFVQPR